MFLGEHFMINDEQTITALWILLREKETNAGMNILSLTERDILENIMFYSTETKKILLNNILENCHHPRATLFRILKKLREHKYIKIEKDKIDKRKSWILISKNIKN